MCISIPAPEVSRELSYAKALELFEATCRNEPLGAEQLKGRRESAVYRLAVDGFGSVILKLWERRGMRGLVRRLTRTSPMDRELDAARLMNRAGVPIPRVLAAVRAPLSGERWTEGLFLEDLGRCEFGLKHVKRLVGEGRDEEVEAVLGQVIAMTVAMVKGGVLDIDHSFTNIVATPAGRAYRLDFELARFTRRPELHAREYGRMLGRLIGTLVYAVQPDTERATLFARDLMDNLRPSPTVLRYVEAHVRRMLHAQRMRNGVDSRVKLPWSGTIVSADDEG